MKVLETRLSSIDNIKPKSKTGGCNKIPSGWSIVEQVIDLDDFITNSCYGLNLAINMYSKYFLSYLPLLQSDLLKQIKGLVKSYLDPKETEVDLMDLL